MFRYEHARQRIISRNKFLLRLLSNLIIVLVLIGISLLTGMLGYYGLEGMDWLNSFENAAMILSGMGPAAELHNANAKLFAGFYAIYSGIAVIAATGLLLAPLLHRIMHSLHVADDESENKKKR